MTIDEAIHTGDRVEFKRLVFMAPVEDLIVILAKATRANVQDFKQIVLAEISRRAQC